MGKQEGPFPGSRPRNRFSAQMQTYRGHHPHCYEKHLEAEEYSRQQKGSAVSKARQRCLEFAHEHVHNELPTHLIRISDMKLVTRNEVLEDVSPLILNSEELSEKQLWGLCRGGWIQACCKVEDYYQDYARGILKFAIFSHRWGAHEPAFYEMSTTRYGEKPKPTGPGYTKLEKFCKQALEYGCAYAWSDTCCINKESSTELEEAIRSMYRWYEGAYVCIVHLAGTGTGTDNDRIVTHDRYGYTSTTNSPYSGGFSAEDPWFERGWTLQELLAPRRLRFFSKDWQPVCPSTAVESDLLSPPFPHPNDKTNVPALETINYITKIPIDVLREFSRARNSISVSDKMKWAMKRRTTRVEDAAYSLLGIFDISMPIAYGEGTRAFHRLMEVLMESSTDPSLFVWMGKPSPYSNALPSAPGCYDLACYSSPNAYTPIAVTCGDGLIGDPLRTLTKVGLRAKLLVVPVECDCCGSRPAMHDLRPMKQGLSRLGVIEQSVTHKEIKSLALGIVNYRPIDDSHGALDTGKDYFCMLLRRIKPDWPWPEAHIGSIVTREKVTFLHCTEDLVEQLETVCILHRNP